MIARTSNGTVAAENTANQVAKDTKTPATVSIVDEGTTKVSTSVVTSSTSVYRDGAKQLALTPGLPPSLLKKLGSTNITAAETAEIKRKMLLGDPQTMKQMADALQKMSPQERIQVQMDMRPAMQNHQNGAKKLALTPGLPPSLLKKLGSTNITATETAEIRRKMMLGDPQTMKQMADALQKMSPQERVQVQMDMRSAMQNITKHLSPEQAAAIKAKAQQQSKSKLGTQGNGHTHGFSGKMPQAHNRGAHGHSHSRTDYFGPSYSALIAVDTAKVKRAARAELNRPFITKTRVKYECPQCSFENIAIYPMVSTTVKCNQCGQYISLPPYCPLPRANILSSTSLEQPMVVPDKRYMDPQLFQFIELGEFFGFEQALKRGATPEIRLPTQDNPTTLHWAVAQFKGDLRFVEALIRHPDMDIDCKTGKNDQTPLMLASYYGATSVCQLLLAGKANMHLVDKCQWTVIHQAAKSGNTFLLDLYQRGGVSLFAKDKDQRTALHWAAYHNRTDCIMWLLERGLNIMARDSEQCIPLHWAALQGHVDSINVLIRHSFSAEQLEAQDQTGEDAQGLAEDKYLRVDDHRKNLYLHVGKLIRGMESELRWRRRFCLVSKAPGTGLKLMELGSFLKYLCVFEAVSIGIFYFKDVFWMTSHMTIATIIFNFLFMATIVGWFRVRAVDPGYIVKVQTGKGSDGTEFGGREVISSLPQQFSILTRNYDEALKVLPRAYGKLDVREGIVIPSRAMRCPNNERIILGYHGYCDWLDVPIGLRNGRHIVLFSTLVFVLSLVWVWFGWQYLSIITQKDASFYNTSPMLTLWLAHFLFYTWASVKGGLPLIQSACQNLTIQEFMRPTAHPYILVKSTLQHLIAINNPFDHGWKTNLFRWLSGQNLLDTPLPPLNIIAAPEEP